MGFVDRLTGKTAARAAKQAGEVQADFAQQASGLLDPFQGIGAQGLEQVGFLTDPQAQFDFLQSNPLFQEALAQGQATTSQAQDDLFASAAARGRLSSGDTIRQVQNLGDISARNTLLAASPLIQQQSQNISGLINTGQNVAAQQGNLLTGQGAALAGGIVGAENARGQGYSNLLNLGAQGLGFFGGGGGFSDQGFSFNKAFGGN